MKEKEESRTGQGTKAGNAKSEKGSKQAEPKKKPETGKSTKK